MDPLHPDTLVDINLWMKAGHSFIWRFGKDVRHSGFSTYDVYDEVDFVGVGGMHMLVLQTHLPYVRATAPTVVPDLVQKDIISGIFLELVNFASWQTETVSVCKCWPPFLTEVRGGTSSSKRDSVVSE